MDAWALKPSIEPLKARKLFKDPSEGLIKFRAASINRSAESIAFSVKEFTAKAKQFLDELSGDHQVVLDAFGYLAADLYSAENHLRAVEIMSPDSFAHLEEIYKDLAAVALKAARHAESALTEIEKVDHMREFSEKAKSTMKRYQNVFRDFMAEKNRPKLAN